jgi:hypothetical protein
VYVALSQCSRKDTLCMVWRHITWLPAMHLSNVGQGLHVTLAQKMTGQHAIVCQLQGCKLQLLRLPSSDIQ